jgi:hypothetical protein
MLIPLIRFELSLHLPQLFCSFNKDIKDSSEPFGQCGVDPCQEFAVGNGSVLVDSLENG